MDLVDPGTSAPPVVKPPFKVTEESLKKRPLSKSSLVEFAKSPAHYVQYLTAPRERTPALVMGSLTDCLVFTPDDFDKKYALAPEINRRTNDGKRDWEKFCIDNAGKDVITQDMHDEATAMKDALFANPKSAELLNLGTTVQREVRWEDKATRLPFIGYTDLDSSEPDFIVDLKTADSADPDDFERAAHKYHYPLQGVMYKEAFARKLFRFPRYILVVVEKKAPYGVAVYDKIQPDFFRYGAQQLDALRQQFRHCLDNDLFHMSYDFRTVDGGHLLDVPGYAKRLINP